MRHLSETHYELFKWEWFHTSVVAYRVWFLGSINHTSFLSVDFLLPTPFPSLSSFVCHFEVGSHIALADLEPDVSHFSLPPNAGVPGECTNFSLLFCYCDKTHWPKAAWGSRGLFGFHFRSQSEENGGKNKSRNHRGTLSTDLFTVLCSASFLTQPSHPQWAGSACIN